MSEIKTLTQEQIDALRKPLPPEAVTQHPTKAYLSSIKVIYIVERLNEVFGIQGWFIEDQFVEKDGEVQKKITDKNGQKEEKIVAGKMVIVRSTLTIPEYGITRSAYGGNDNPDLGDAYKGACTDALSKIASYLYIGMDVYKGLGANPPASKPRPVAKPAEKVADKPAAAKAPAPTPKTDATSVTLTGKVASEIKQNDKGTWIKVGSHPVHVWDFDKHIKNNKIAAGCEIEIEAMPKINAKGGSYYELVKVITIVPAVA
jgi:hypothetical protein